VCVFLLSSLLSSCGNNRKEQINEACTLIDFAWDVYDIAFRMAIERENLSYINLDEYRRAQDIASEYIPEASGYLKDAGLIFRDLSASDSGFTDYASRAFFISKFHEIEWVSRSGFEQNMAMLINFCGAD
jgi:hypothetical protein